MTLDLLITTMNQTDYSLLNEMNVSGDAIVANQCNENKIEEIEYNGNKIVFLSSNTRGKSINQNLGIMYSKADIILFADDDIVLQSDYEKKVISFFESHRDADAVKFYCESTNPERPLSFKQPSKVKSVRKTQIMSAGTPLLAVRRDFLVDNGIFFNISIGPGTECPNGEDGVFYSEMFRHNVKLYVTPELLGYAKQDGSSWFKTFDKKYFYNSGIIYKMIYGGLSDIFILRRALLFNKNKTELSLLERLNEMKKGKKSR